jgi:predicted amidohydrolase
MKIGIIQKELHWENVEKNLVDFEGLLQSVDSDCDVVFLPEMFSTGFTMKPSGISPDEILKVPLWLQEMSEKNGIAIGGSSIAGTSEYFNRFYFSEPGVKMRYYDKRHLFRMGEELLHYKRGNERKIFDFRGWRILPQICYDLRFPVWNRNRCDYDIAVYVANWPAVRQDVWLTLLKARAIENQCFVAGVNRTGKDPMTVYDGGSVVFSPKGEEISFQSDSHNSILYAVVDLKELKDFREKFPAWMDADDFQILLNFNWQ